MPTSNSGRGLAREPNGPDVPHDCHELSPSSAEPTAELSGRSLPSPKNTGALSSKKLSAPPSLPLSKSSSMGVGGLATRPESISIVTCFF